jgi:FAD/FMN-containing dehydrogenase
VATPFDVLFQGMDAAFPPGKRYAGDTLWLAGEVGALSARAASRFALAPSRRSVMLCIYPRPGGALPDCAFSMVGPMYLGCYAIWNDATDDDANTRWLREATTSMDDVTIGFYVGEADLAEHESRSRRSFSAGNWQRLQTLRKIYDPSGLFHDYLGR